MGRVYSDFADEENGALQALQPGVVPEGTGKPVWSYEEILDSLIYIPLRPFGSDLPIRYAFPEDASFHEVRGTNNGEEKGFSQLNPFQQEQARLAYSLWDDLIATSVIEVADPFEADMTISNSTVGVGFAHASVPGGPAWLNPDFETLINPEFGSHGFKTIIHELGHSFGLVHGIGPEQANGRHALDSHMYSVMSYRWAYDTGGEWTGADGIWYQPQTPMLHDIAAIQQMYGADMTTRSGDTVYGFNSNIDSPIYDFARNANPVLSIWDAGGIDTLDLSGFAPAANGRGSVVNLAPGSFSDAGPMINNISIAYGAWIENAIGGSGHDTITGNELANELIGNAGNDILNGEEGDDFLDGGAGRDTLNGGAGDDVLVYDASDGASRLNGGSGTDTLLIRGGQMPTFDLASRGIEFAEYVQTGSAHTTWSRKSDLYDQSWTHLSQEGEAKDGSSWKTEWDVDGEQSWVSRTDIYSATGQHIEQTGERDNGQTWHHTWDVDGAGPWARITHVEDAADTATWRELTNYVNASGQTVERKGIKDNGQTWHNIYDVDETQSWSMLAHTYTQAGDRLTTMGHEDNGETWVQRYDHESKWTWSDITSSFTQSGEKYKAEGVQDNGQLWVRTWDVDGTEPWARQVSWDDAPDLAGWREHTLYLNDDDQVYRQTGIRDDGDAWEHTWDRAGAELWHRQTVYTDVQDIRGWAERIQTFDENGALLSTSYVDDFI